MENVSLEFYGTHMMIIFSDLSVVKRFVHVTSEDDAVLWTEL